MDSKGLIVVPIMACPACYSIMFRSEIQEESGWLYINYKCAYDKCEEHNVTTKIEVRAEEEEV